MKCCLGFVGDTKKKYRYDQMKYGRDERADGKKIKIYFLKKFHGNSYFLIRICFYWIIGNMVLYVKEILATKGEFSTGENYVYYGLKESIFVEVVVLFVTGRNILNTKNGILKIMRFFLKIPLGFSSTIVQLRADVRSEDYGSKESNGSRVTGWDFAFVNQIVRFTSPARIIVTGQIMSSFLKRQNSNAPRIRQ
jgi:hypothetical protein